jgi:hypothetical protein
VPEHKPIEFDLLREAGDETSRMFSQSQIWHSKQKFQFFHPSLITSTNGLGPTQCYRLKETLVGPRSGRNDS